MKNGNWGKAGKPLRAGISPHPLPGASGEWLFQVGSFSRGILPVQLLQCGGAQGWEVSRFQKREHSEADLELMLLQQQQISPMTSSNLFNAGSSQDSYGV